MGGEAGTVRERYSHDCYTKFQFLPSVYCNRLGGCHVSGSYAVQQIVEHNTMFGIPAFQRDANALVVMEVSCGSGGSVDDWWWW